MSSENHDETTQIETGMKHVIYQIEFCRVQSSEMCNELSGLRTPCRLFVNCVVNVVTVPTSDFAPNCGKACWSISSNFFASFSRSTAPSIGAGAPSNLSTTTRSPQTTIGIETWLQAAYGLGVLAANRVRGVIQIECLMLTLF